MMNDMPFIYLFQVQAIGQYFIYDVNKNQVIRIDDDVYNYLSNQQITVNQIKTNHNVKSCIENLKSLGYLSSKHASEIEHPLTEYCQDYIASYISSMTLQVTQSCNMRCRYCSFSGDGSLNRKHQKKSMSHETAIKAVDFLANHSSEVDQIDIGFYGGEPLLEFNLIKEVVTYANEIMPDKHICYYITTNGTIANDEVLEFLNDNNVKVTLSMDGPSDIHDRYRRFAKNGAGTFNTVYKNLMKIYEKYPSLFLRLSINAVIDRDADVGIVESFFNNDELLKNITVQINAVADNYIDFNYTETVEHIISEEELLFKQLVDRIRGKEARIKSQYFNRVIGFSTQIYETNELPHKIHHQGPCMPGQNKLFVDVYGVIRPCEKVGELCEPMIIGNVRDGIDIQKIVDLLNVGKLTKDECLNCWAIRLCKQCAMFADDTKTLCRNKKILECKNQYYSIKELLKDYVIYKSLGIIKSNDM